MKLVGQILAQMLGNSEKLLLGGISIWRIENNVRLMFRIDPFHLYIETINALLIFIIRSADNKSPNEKRIHDIKSNPYRDLQI